VHAQQRTMLTCSRRTPAGQAAEQLSKDSIDDLPHAAEALEYGLSIRILTRPEGTFQAPVAGAA